MGKIIFLLIFFFIFLFPLSLAFNCTIREGSCTGNEVAVISLVKETNAHVGSYDKYNYKLCCDFDFVAIRSNCEPNEGEVLSLYKTYNSHAAKKGYYQNRVCATLASEPANCTIRQNQCSINEACIISLAKETNAHAARCDYYPWKICCRVYPDLYVNESSISFNVSEPYVGDTLGINITVWNIGDAAATQVNVSCYDNGNYFDSYIINSIPPNPSMQEPRYAYCELKTDCPIEHNISIRVDPNNLVKEYNKSNNFASKSITLKERLFVYIDSPTEGQSFYRGSDVNLQSTVNDSCYPFPSATVNWYNESTLIGSGEDIVWTIPLADFMLGTKTIRTEASAAGYSTAYDTVQITILNNPPTVSTPSYNVTPAEIHKGESIEISCVANDIEDTAENLRVNISVKDPAGNWDNITANRIGNTFYRSYSTSDTSLIGYYTAVCTVWDTDNGYNSSASQFVVYQNVSVIINLNATKVWWNDAVNCTIQAIRKDNSYVSSADVEIKVNDSVKCSAKAATDSFGKYTCIFNAPNSTDTFIVNASVIDPLTDKLFYNTTLLEVSPTLGEEEVAPQIACYEEPQIIQNPDGTLEEVRVKVCVWK